MRRAGGGGVRSYEKRHNNRNTDRHALRGERAYGGMEKVPDITMGNQVRFYVIFLENNQESQLPTQRLNTQHRLVLTTTTPATRFGPDDDHPRSRGGDAGQGRVPVGLGRMLHRLIVVAETSNTSSHL